MGHMISGVKVLVILAAAWACTVSVACNGPTAAEERKFQTAVDKLYLARGSDINEPDFLDTTPLAVAARLGYLQTCEWLIEKRGADINAKDDRGFTALHNAAFEGRLSSVRFLLAKGADVNAADNEGLTALHLATERSDTPVIRALLDSRADVDAKGGECRDTPLILAAYHGDLDAAKMLLDKGASPDLRGVISGPDEEGFSALDIAAQKGNIHLARLLLAHGAKVGVPEGSDIPSSLALACREGHLDMVRFLVEQGADVKQLTYGRSLTEVASTRGRFEVTKWLLSRGVPCDIYSAVALGDEKTISELVAADPKVLTKGKPPILAFAFDRDRLELVPLLIAKGADANAKDGEWTILHIAVHKGKTDLVKQLLGAGAKINAPADFVGSPAHVAAWAGKRDILSLLLRSGAAVNALNTDGKTPLDVAMTRKPPDSEIITLLRKRGGKAAQELAIPAEPSN